MAGQTQADSATDRNLLSLEWQRLWGGGLAVLVSSQGKHRAEEGCGNTQSKGYVRDAFPSTPHPSTHVATQIQILSPLCLNT